MDRLSVAFSPPALAHELQILALQGTRTELNEQLRALVNPAKRVSGLTLTPFTPEQTLSLLGEDDPVEPLYHLTLVTHKS